MSKTKKENKEILLKRVDSDILGHENERKRIVEKHEKELEKFDEGLELLKLEKDAIKKI